MIPYTRSAYELLHRGTLAFAKAEVDGMHVDMDYVNGAIAKGERKLRNMHRELANTEVAKTWRGMFGAKTNLQSDTQLGKVLFGPMGFTPIAFTDKSTPEDLRPKTSEDVISKINHPFVRKYIEAKKLQKNIATNLRGIRREAVNGKLHCFFDLIKPKTFRSSSSNINFHNQPTRDPDSAKLIRSAFIPRPGRQLVEVDFSGAEVCAGTAYHHDPVMIDYLTDKENKDMHRDMAMEIFKLPLEEAAVKAIRNTVKGPFVFAEFYGDWYAHCAVNIWDLIAKHHLKLIDGTPLIKHLRRKGLGTLGSVDPKAKPVRGTFMHHLQSVENAFWGERFKVYAQWKWDAYDLYKTRGWLKMLTGFVCQGYMGKNDVVNYPIQGTSFHCLLWVFNRLVLEELRKRKMKTIVVGQIHDSIVADAVPEELPEYLGICHDLITNKLQRHFPWLVVPMSAEAEVAPVGATWYEKKKVEWA